MTDLGSEVDTELMSQLSELRTRKKLDAVVEAARAAVVVAVPRLRSQYTALSERHGAASPQRPSLWSARSVITVSAFLLGVVAAGIALPSPRDGRPALGVDDASIWVGVLAAVTVLVSALLESGRRDCPMMGAHTRNAPRLYLFLAILWTLVLAYMIGNWDDVNSFEPELPITGLVLLGCAIIGIAVLAVIARRHDRVALSDPAVAAKDEWGVIAGDDSVGEWWAKLPSALSPVERGAANRSYAVTIDVLERERVIRPRDARRLRRKNPSVVWRGDAG